MTIKKILCFSLVLCMKLSFAGSVEHVVWDKTPIRIKLPLNQERLIKFPMAISIVDSELDESAGILKIQDTLYFNAHAAFSNKRLVVQLMPQGEAIVLNLSTNEEISDTTPIEILMAENNDEAQSSPSTIKSSDINAVTLTRFAIQSLYSPERLLVTPAEVSRTPMQTHRNITLIYGASITAKPLLSWHADNLYVTAVELKNELNKEVTIDPRQILGDWQTATFYPTNTLKARHNKETTTLFLTSNRPFGEALSNSREFVR
jgi:integrating conjugative element protein (TIGR03749 family)